MSVLWLLLPLLLPPGPSAITASNDPPSFLDPTHPPENPTGIPMDGVSSPSSFEHHKVRGGGSFSLPLDVSNTSNIFESSSEDVMDLSAAHCDVCVNGAEYCDSTWLPYPNMNRALLGIDIAKKHPMPLKPEGDPSYRATIFNSVFRNLEFGNMESYSFIHATDSVVCTAQFEEISWENIEEFIKGSAESSMSDWDLGFDLDGMEFGFEGFTITPPPSSGGYGQSDSDNALSMEAFFSKEGGSISHSKAKCSLYQVIVDINEPSLSLHPSFTEAIKRIDKAKTETEKEKVMSDFIGLFGTHYAKETVMGLGVDFETRYTEEETLNYDRQTRNKCSSESGGFSIFGFGGGGGSSECTGSLEDTTQGSDTAVSRFRVSTYGTLLPGTPSLSDWSNMVSDMWKDGTLAPVPIRQDLRLILEIFLTPAVAAITHDDGSMIDVDNVMQTSLQHGFSNYCQIFSCDIPSCATTLHMANPSQSTPYMFRYYNEQHREGRMVFKDHGTNHFLYFQNGRWNVGLSYEDKDVVLTTSPCPHTGTMFEDPISEPSYTTSSWTDCSANCFDATVCNYWQYEAETKLCTLIEDYARMVTTTAEVFTGTRDCPGEMYQVAYGLCAENYVARSMWIQTGEDAFTKNLEMEEFDPNNIIIVGGSTTSGLSEVEMFGERDCYVPNLPSANYGNSLFLTSSSLLSCGGDYNQPAGSGCIFLDVQRGAWTEHSTLTQSRWLATGVTLQSGSYLFGGSTSPTTSEYLPESSTTWQAGPQVPGKGIYRGCGVAVSDSELVLIGGVGTESRVVKYDIRTDKWTTLESLKVGRAYLACAVLHNDIIVSGGMIGSSSTDSTELISLTTWRPRPGGNLKTARYAHALITMGGSYPRLLAIGGARFADADGGSYLDSVEEWDEDKEEWMVSPISLKTARRYFGALAIPPSVACGKK